MQRTMHGTRKTTHGDQRQTQAARRVTAAALLPPPQTHGRPAEQQQRMQQAPRPPALGRTAVRPQQAAQAILQRTYTVPIVLQRTWTGTSLRLRLATDPQTPQTCHFAPALQRPAAAPAGTTATSSTATCAACAGITRCTRTTQKRRSSTGRSAKDGTTAWPRACEARRCALLAGLG